MSQLNGGRMTMQLQLALTDTPIHTITPTQSRTNSRSAKADSHKSLATSKTRALVLQVLESAGPSGLTRNEIAERSGLLLSSVCGRVNELLSVDNPKIQVLGKEFRRDGKSVLVFRS